MGRRLLFVLLAVAVAAGVAFVVLDRFGTPDAVASRRVLDEAIELMRAGNPAAAEALLEREEDRLRPPDRAYGEGLLLLNKGAYADAVAPLETAYTAFPDDAAVLDVFCASLLNSGDAARARDVAEAFVAAHPKDRRGYWVAGNMWFEPGNVEACKRSAELLEALHPLIVEAVQAGVPAEELGVGWPEFMELIARVMTQTGRHTQALDYAATLAKQSNTVRSKVLLGDTARAAAFADMFFRQFLFIAEKAYAEAAEAADPEQRLRILFNLIQVQFELPEREKECLERAQQLVDEHPDDLEVKVLYARALVRQGKNPWMDEAASVYRSVLAVEPNHLAALRNLAVLLYDWKQGGRRGQYLEEAFGLLVRYVKAGGVIDNRNLAGVFETLRRHAEGDAAATHAADARVAFMRGDYAAAADAAARAIGLDGEVAAYQVQLVDALFGLPDRRADLEAASAALMERFGDDPLVRAKRAEAIIARQTDESAPEAAHIAAVRDLTAVLGLHPDDRALCASLAFSIKLAGGSPKLDSLRGAVPGLAELPVGTWQVVLGQLQILEKR